MADSKAWLITGVSSGIGLELARAALATGDRVVGTVRGPDDGSFAALAPDRASLIQLDVEDAARTAPAVAEAVARLGGLDVLVNNAGAGVFGPVEACSVDDFRDVMEVNVFGLLRICQAAIPHLRASRGTLVNFSSMAGIAAYAGFGPYCASKYAVQALSEVLHAELAPDGVKVMVALPGGFRTNFWAARSLVIRAGAEGIYDTHPAGKIAKMSTAYMGKQPGDPARLARLVVDAVNSDHPPLNLVAGGDAIDTVSAKIAQVAGDILYRA